jgi:hypothetical protein
MKVEARFKEAGLVRARTAIMMMNRTILLLRHQMLRMIFAAWKNSNTRDAKHEETIERLIRISELRTKDKNRRLAFQVWRGYVSRVVDEREQKLTIASRRCVMYVELGLYAVHTRSFTLCI